MLIFYYKKTKKIKVLKMYLKKMCPVKEIIWQCQKMWHATKKRKTKMKSEEQLEEGELKQLYTVFSNMLEKLEKKHDRKTKGETKWVIE